MFRVRHEYPLLRPGVSKSRIHQSDSGVNGPAPCTWHSERENVDQVCRVRGRLAKCRLREPARAAVTGGRGGQADVSPHQRKYAEADEIDCILVKQLARRGGVREVPRESVETKNDCRCSARCLGKGTASAGFATA